jgi:peptide chain release factor
VIWILVTAGRGPSECQIAVGGITDILIQEARAAGLEVDLIDFETGQHGYLSTLVALRGLDAASFAKGWKGTVKWVCQSDIRPTHRRKNWFVSVGLLEPPPPERALRTQDIRFEAYRASGPGGQHVNTTSSAVRVTHLPTGLVAQAQEERSQHRNKSLAMARLAEAIADGEHSARRQSEQDRWAHHDALERGDAVRTYVGKDFKRKT